MATQAIDPPYVSDIDPFSHEAILDAIHHDSLLREVGPVVYLPQYDIWVVARHAEAQEVLRDWETFSSEGRPFHDPTSIRPEVLLTSDPPSTPGCGRRSSACSPARRCAGWARTSAARPSG